MPVTMTPVLRKVNIFTGTGRAVTGTGGAVCKEATLSVEQQEDYGGPGPVLPRLKLSW
jgi:hypothetical protein